ncbi:hypothetical protein IFM89_017608 [Coptis chinensis]|uniref:Methyltransferase small domain-containing protein n=1 Tax=Coptis chinensis TaxID=261450 RepID=A0A835GWX2_9MAGN|nr:hypothetical protein IFM89_017608 [Coptis chinensis]
MITPCLPRNIRYTITPCSLFFKRQTTTSLHFTERKTISSKPLQPLQLPLFLKPPIYTTTIYELKTFQNWANNLAISTGSKFLDLDNGPESSLLCRELNWLLEDVVESEWPTSFLTLGTVENERVVKMKTEMEHLYVLWKQRIEERRPFQYIVGCEHWRDLVLCVQEGVLIPRPETELIVDMVEEVVLENEVMKEGVWLDLGTGSGALGVAIGRVLGKEGRVIATDLSPVAASVTSFNVQRYGLQDKVEIRIGSWFEPLEDVKGKLVGIVSNPPYIPSEDIPGLQAEVVRHEPKLALDGGETGMDDLLQLCEGAASFLKPGGFFVFENEESGQENRIRNAILRYTNGEKQSKYLVDFMDTKTKGSFRHLKIVSDFAGVQRFVIGYRN